MRSATGKGDLPDAGLPELSMVGRSNVGKSTLINALVGRKVARTSAAPGKTRLINLYRVVTKPTGPFYLVDLPGYGYARKKEAKAEFDRMADAYFARVVPVRVLLAVDARHPGMETDLDAIAWLRGRGLDPLVVVTKIDKLSRSERARSLREFDRLFGNAVLGVSAENGEGLEELWKQVASWVVTAAANNPRRFPTWNSPPSRK